MNLKNVEIKECPYCGGTEFGEGSQIGHGKLSNGIFSLGAILYHTVCMDCGSVVRSYVENPERFRDKP